jgi:hypothetical protein
MAAHHIEAPFARWLLRARDLAGSDHLRFTQEFLAEVLGVQRTSISPVADTFQRAGIIRYGRGRIEVLDVEALRESACECYEAVRASYNSLLDGSGTLPLGNGLLQIVSGKTLTRPALSDIRLSADS